MPGPGREMLGWYLMKEGRRDAGEAEFELLRGEFGDDPDVILMLGNARANAGDEAAALDAFESALVAAKLRGDRQAIGMARSERRVSHEALALPKDDEDRRAPRPLADPLHHEHVVLAVGWFPRSEREAALHRWRELEEDLGDADAYCDRIERHMRELAEASGRRPSVAPLTVTELVAYAEREGIDPADGATRASLAADLIGAAGPLRGRPAATSRAGVARVASTSAAAVADRPSGIGLRGRTARR